MTEKEVKMLVRDNETESQLLEKLKKAITDAGILWISIDVVELK
jgi:hypothetical protein